MTRSICEHVLELVRLRHQQTDVLKYFVSVERNYLSITLSCHLAVGTFCMKSKILWKSFFCSRSAFHLKLKVQNCVFEDFRLVSTCIEKLHKHRDETCWNHQVLISMCPRVWWWRSVATLSAAGCSSTWSWTEDTEHRDQQCDCAVCHQLSSTTPPIVVSWPGCRVERRCSYPGYHPTPWSCTRNCQLQYSSSLSHPALQTQNYFSSHLSQQSLEETPWGRGWPGRWCLEHIQRQGDESPRCIEFSPPSPAQIFQSTTRLNCINRKYFSVTINREERKIFSSNEILPEHISVGRVQQVETFLEHRLIFVWNNSFVLKDNNWQWLHLCWINFQA